MNPEQRLERLQTLLQRVQTRAKQGRGVVAARPRRMEPTAVRGEEAPARPVSDLKTDPLSALPILEELGPAEPHEPEPAPDASLEAAPDTEVRPDETLGADLAFGGADEWPTAVGSEGLASAAAEEPWESRVATPPPHPSAVAVAPDRRLADAELPRPELEVDLSAMDALRESKESSRPSVEQLGQTIELEEFPQEAVTIEVDERVPELTSKVPPSESEMEAVIPQAGHTAAPPRAPEPPRIPDLTTDVDVLAHLDARAREEAVSEGPPTEAAVDVGRESRPPSQRPEVPAEALRKIAEPGPVAVASMRDAGEPTPVVLQIEGETIRSTALTAGDVASFVSAPRAERTDRFLDLLDASLSLGA